MKKLVACCACLSLLAVLPSCATTSTPAPAPVPDKPAGGKSLYERLGGMDAIKAVISDFIDAQASDPKLHHFYEKTDTKYLKGQISDFVCQAAGGPCKYTGMDMKDAHDGRHVHEEDFNVTVGHLVDVLNKYKVPDAEQKELLALLGPLKPDIVEAKK
jgi:hemoglobin